MTELHLKRTNIPGHYPSIQLNLWMVTAPSLFFYFFFGEGWGHELSQLNLIGAKRC